MIYVCITVINEFGALKVIHVFSITRIGTNITEIGNDVTCIGDITRAGIFPDCLDEKRSNLDFVIYFLESCSDSFEFFYFKKCQLGSFMLRRKTDAIQSLQSPFSLARMAQIGLIFTFRPFSRKTFQTVLRFLFKKMPIGVLHVAYKDECH